MNSFTAKSILLALLLFVSSIYGQISTPSPTIDDNDDDCTCSSYANDRSYSGNETLVNPSGNGCIYCQSYCSWIYDTCYCEDKDYCDAVENIAKGLATIVLVIIVIVIVCCLLCIGGIICCITGGTICCCAAAQPRKTPQQTVAVVTVPATNSNKNKSTSNQ